VKCGWRKAAERFGDFRSGDGPGFVERFSGEEFGESGGRSDGGDAALSLETHGGDFAVIDAHGEAKNVAADGIRDVHRSRGVGKIACVAWIFEMIDNGCRVHRKKYGKGRAEIQRGVDGKILP